VHKSGRKTSIVIIIYALTSPGWVSLTEAKAAAGIAVWITQTYKPRHHVIHYGGDQNSSF